MDDVFCKIIAGEIKADAVYKDADFWVVKDINPQAPIHLLVIPVKHFTSLEDFMDPVRSKTSAKSGSSADHAFQAGRTSNGMEGDNDGLLGRALKVAHKVAHEVGIVEKGYRLILNEGEDGGKLVPHLHIHLLGGKKLGPKIIG
ncbi:MAG: HIT domain-containing protein [bacterium]|nr:HIT domain-containing protein [bacterium]